MQKIKNVRVCVCVCHLFLAIVWNSHIFHCFLSDASPLQKIYFVEKESRPKARQKWLFLNKFVHVFFIMSLKCGIIIKNYHYINCRFIFVIVALFSRQSFNENA